MHVLWVCSTYTSVVLAAVTLFELTVVNNWYVIMDGYAAEFTEWSRIYFMLFYLVTMVIMTVVVTFILDAFIFRMQYGKTVSGHDIDGEKICYFKRNFRY